MRAGFVNRTDLPKGLYIDDIEDTSRRNFSSQPKGQSRVLRRPTDSEVQAVLTATAFVSSRATNTAASVDTSSNDTLRIKTSSSASFTVIAVTSGGTTAKTVIAADLNAAFTAAGLDLLATVAGTNQIQIETTVGTASVIIDSVGNGSTLSTAVGFTAGGVTVAALSVSALRTGVYPTSTTIDVSSATLLALAGNFSNLATAKQTAYTTAVQDLIAPEFIETSLVLLSFVNGVLGKAAATSFQPGGTRIGLTAGPAIACLADDGTTPFTV